MSSMIRRMQRAAKREASALLNKSSIPHFGTRLGVTNRNAAKPYSAGPRVLRGQSVGRIVSVVEGWQYQPRKSKNHGEVFGSIAEVKTSLA